VAATADSVRLTEFSHGAGCACKIGAGAIKPLLATFPPSDDPRLLVGYHGSDDAAVYRLSDDLALVHTADFFTPILDDPYDFGRVAAANALSDVYAMGAKPVLALNLVAFSLEDLGSAVLLQILRGGADVAAAAGVPIAGGHSIDDREPKYGLAVAGTVHPDRLVTNAAAEPGDVLLLTKPVGAGLVTTAAKRGLASAELVTAATAVMVQLNAEASEDAVAAGVHAMTDVTGFGLLGHLHEMCSASGLAAEVTAGAVPAIEGALALADDERCVSGGSRRNAADGGAYVTWSDGVAPQRRVLLSDAMTSGGLLLAVSPTATAAAPGVAIGRLVEGPAGQIRVSE
jgi:selenide,water dikinase